MGLSVCYEFRAPVDIDVAREIVQALHDAAVALPFQGVHEILEWQESDSTKNLDPHDAQWLRIFGTQYGYKPRVDGEECWIEIPPKHVIAFGVGVADGAETAQFGLAAHPAVLERSIGGKTEWIETGLAGIYSWAQCCKTQYAGLQQFGGAENFLRAHVALIELLDHARELGVQVDVHDDSGYWVDRDRERLICSLREWNGLVAALAGQLKDRLGTDKGGVQAPIFSAPDFEHLEAEGLAQWTDPGNQTD